MAEVNPPSFVQARTDHTAEQTRQALKSLLGNSGIVASTDLLVTANGTPNMTVNVAAGDIWIPGTESAAQGWYHCRNDASKSLNISAADATNARKDLIVAKVQDAAYSGGTNAWSLVVVTGTPSGSPAEPTAPANSITLAMIDVPATDTTISSGQITDRRTKRASALGGIIPTTAASVPTGAQGIAVYVTDAAVPSGAVAPQTSGRPNAPGLYVYDARYDPPWNLPWGVMGFASTTTTQTGITNTEVNLTSLTVTFTAVANRRIRVRGYVPIVRTDAGGGALFSVRITDSANALQNAWREALYNINEERVAEPEFIGTPSAGSVTYKLRGLTSAGSVTFSTQVGAGTAAAYIIVDDLGPNGQPA